MTICAKFDGRRVEDCTRGDGCHCAKETKEAAGAYRLCATCEVVITGDFGLTPSQCRACIAEGALRLSQKEVGFLRLAYDQKCEELKDALHCGEVASEEQKKENP